jgi:hypothetical protein
MAGELYPLPGVGSLNLPGGGQFRLEGCDTVSGLFGIHPLHSKTSAARPGYPPWTGNLLGTEAAGGRNSRALG